jgi:hypothetical protein
MPKAMLLAAVAVPGSASMQPSVLSVPTAAETNLLMGLLLINECEMKTSFASWSAMRSVRGGTSSQHC